MAHAADATHGQLVNARGESLGVEPPQLFTGPGVVDGSVKVSFKIG